MRACDSMHLLSPLVSPSLSLRPALCCVILLLGGGRGTHDKRGRGERKHALLCNVVSLSFSIGRRCVNILYSPTHSHTRLVRTSFSTEPSVAELD